MKLSCRRNHLVRSYHRVPTRFGLPSRFIDRASQRFDAKELELGLGTVGGDDGHCNLFAQSRPTPLMLAPSKHELRVMLAQGSGSIVNVSSTYGHRGAAGASIYSASKHAVEGLSKSAALEAASSGVRVNMVAQGSNRDWDVEPLHRY